MLAYLFRHPVVLYKFLKQKERERVCVCAVCVCVRACLATESEVGRKDAPGRIQAVATDSRATVFWATIYARGSRVSKLFYKIESK